MAASAPSPEWASGGDGAWHVCQRRGAFPERNSDVDRREQAFLVDVGGLRQQNEIRRGRLGLVDEVTGRIHAEARQHHAIDSARPDLFGQTFQLAHDAGHLRKLDRQAGADFQRGHGLRPEGGQDDLRRLLGGGEIGGKRYQWRVDGGVVDHHEHAVGVDDAEGGPLGLFDLPLHDAVGVDDLEQRRRHDGRHDRHHHEHGEQRRVQDLELEPDGQQHQLGEPRVFSSRPRACERAGSGCLASGRPRKHR